MQFPYQLTAKGTYSLKNVRLETGFEYENDEVTGTKTNLFSIEIEDGKIKEIKANDPASNAIDAKGYLMLPLSGICTSIWTKHYMDFHGRHFHPKEGR